MILILKRPSPVAAKTLTGIVAGTTDTVFHDCRIINFGSLRRSCFVHTGAASEVP
jgi:hypothetical protein